MTLMPVLMLMLMLRATRAPSSFASLVEQYRADGRGDRNGR
jgi:hypothetical protein